MQHMKIVDEWSRRLLPGELDRDSSIGSRNCAGVRTINKPRSIAKLGDTIHWPGYLIWRDYHILQNIEQRWRWPDWSAYQCLVYLPPDLLHSPYLHLPCLCPCWFHYPHCRYYCTFSVLAWISGKQVYQAVVIWHAFCKDAIPRKWIWPISTHYNH